MGPPSYMRSVVDRNVVMRRISVFSMDDYRIMNSNSKCMETSKA